uniref:IBB domain-containing protein n=1 Tax=Lactuca sativa TaxID=4236 RepID=A0A9R1XM47_LACSA|nr:hypothetical protein LSAT_V11C300121400 [Lactuca sativa]
MVEVESTIDHMDWIEKITGVIASLLSSQVPKRLYCSSIVDQLLQYGANLLEAAWCLTNIAAGKPEETRALLHALPLLIAQIGGEGEELRQILISQGALLPLAKMMFPNKVSTVRNAAWGLSNCNCN